MWDKHDVSIVHAAVGKKVLHVPWDKKINPVALAILELRVRMLMDNQLGYCLTANWPPTCHTSTFICADVCMYKECDDYHKSLLQYITINSFYPTSYIKIMLYTKIDIIKLYQY